LLIYDEMHGKTSCMKLQTKWAFRPAAIKYLTQKHNAVSKVWKSA